VSFSNPEGVLCDECGLPTTDPKLRKLADGSQQFLCETCATYCVQCEGSGEIKPGVPCHYCKSTGIAFVEPSEEDEDYDDYFGW